MSGCSTERRPCRASSRFDPSDFSRSQAVALKVNCDLQLTLMASSLYRLLAVRVGNGYESAKSRHLFRDFIDGSAGVTITESDVEVKLSHDRHFGRVPKLFQCSQHQSRLILASDDFSSYTWPG